MSKRRSVERGNEREHLLELAAEPKLTEEESEWVGRAPGTPLTGLPVGEQELVVTRHLDKIRELPTTYSFVPLSFTSSG